MQLDRDRAITVAMTVAVALFMAACVWWVFYKGNAFNQGWWAAQKGMPESANPFREKERVTFGVGGTYNLHAEWSAGHAAYGERMDERAAWVGRIAEFGRLGIAFIAGLACGATAWRGWYRMRAAEKWRHWNQHYIDLD